MNPAPLIAKTDRQIKWLLAALCGPVVEYDGGVLDVMAEPVERLFPLELLDRAVGAGCMGLAVDDSFMEGPAARELRRARPPATK